MREHRLCAALSLIRQGLSLEVEFGTRSLESLLWIAETIEESVYVAGSLERTPDGLRFALANPPLRLGGFRAIRVFVDGAQVPPDQLLVRTGTAASWTPSTAISGTAPLELRPGVRAEFVVAGWSRAPAGHPTIRLELESVAIPPLVWLEFSDDLRAPGAP